MSAVDPRLAVFNADMTRDELQDTLQRFFTLAEVSEIADGKLRFNDGSRLDIDLWNAACDVEAGA